jgi:hypothetical protein
MQQNSSQWLRRMREKHRRIWRNGEVHKQVEEGQVQQKKVLVGFSRLGKETKTNGNSDNVLSLEQRRLSSGKLPLTSFADLEKDMWELRKQFILQIAKRRNGKVRLQDVAAECNVNIRIAAEWLIRLSMEGMLSLVAGQRHVMTYLVKDAGVMQK